MSNLMSEFEQQFATVTADITSHISILTNREQSSEGKKKNVIETDKLIEEAKELLERMDLEIRDAPHSQRDRFITRLKSYTVELSRLEEEFTRAKKSTFSEKELRNALFDGGAGLSSNDEQKQRLIQNTETLEHTSERLTQGYRIALETEQVGAHILADLHEQRQTVTRARDRLREADGELDQSSRLLNTMMRRALQNKFIVYAVVLFIIVAIIVAIYLAIKN